MNPISTLSKSSLRSRYRMSPIWFLLHPRRFQAYCVGTAKSGTHSIANLFNHQYRAVHEPEDKLIVELLLKTANSTVSRNELVEFAKQRDKRLWLELDSSHLNYFFLDIFVEEFRDAKFILTIRDCYSWLNSLINHRLSRAAIKHWLALDEYYFGSEDIEYAQPEEILAEHGLYPLDSYLSHWAKHNNRVLAEVPPVSLLVVRTHEISQSVDAIAEFINVPVETLNTSKSHSFEAKKKVDFLSNIDRDFLEEKVDLHCKVLMERFFPEIQNYDDVL